MRPIFQVIEINAQIAPKKTIPNPREVSLGINAGMKATAYTAAFALVKLVIRPNLKETHAEVTSSLSRSNFPNSLRRDRKVCTEIKVRNKTPDHFRIEYAVSDRVKIAESPIALDTLQIKIPRQFPSDERKAAFGPPMIDWRRTMATPCPGIITNKAVATINEGRLPKSAVTITYSAA
jgi:hypothetical protein